jgi:hypothetical protein
LSETTNPGFPLPHLTTAESGKSEVSVHVGTPAAPPDPGGAAKGNFVRDNWAMIVFLIGAVFSAGILWNKVDQLEKQQVTLKADMTKGFESLGEKMDTFTIMSMTNPTSDDF